MLEELKKCEEELLFREQVLKVQTAQGMMTVRYMESPERSRGQLEDALALRPHLEHCRKGMEPETSNHLLLICDTIKHGLDGCGLLGAMMRRKRDDSASIAAGAGKAALPGIDDDDKELNDFFAELDLYVDAEDETPEKKLCPAECVENPLTQLEEDETCFTIYSEEELDEGACNDAGETPGHKNPFAQPKVIYPVMDAAALIVKCDGMTALSDATVELLTEQGDKPMIVVVPRRKMNRKQVERLMFEGGFEIVEISEPSLETMAGLLRKMARTAGFELETADENFGGTSEAISDSELQNVIRTVKQARGELFCERDLWLLLGASLRMQQGKVLNQLVMPRYAGKSRSGRQMLERIVGLEEIKEILTTEINRQAYRKKLTEHLAQQRTAAAQSGEAGSFALLDDYMPCRNMAFTGNPGTCKTTMARAMATCMTEMGLSNGTFLEVGREQLVGRYLGETSLKVAGVFKKVRGGVLFIDEVGSLAGDYSDSYGKEAVSAIVRHMENERETTVILAGYPGDMEDLMEVNEGLRSRIGRMVNFPDYGEEQLTEIFNSMAKGRGYHLESGCDRVLTGYFKKIMKQKDFGNGREARRLLDQAEGQLANAVMSGTAKEFCLLTVSAIEEAAGILLGESRSKDTRMPIGFAPRVAG